MGIGAIQGILIARVLGVNEYGILGLITTYALFINQLVDSRVWETVIKFVAQFRSEGDSAKAAAVIKLSYLIDICTGTISFVLVLLTASLAAAIIVKDASMTQAIQLFGLSVLLTIPRDTSSAVLRINNRFRWLAYYNGTEAILRFVGIIMILINNGGITQILIVYLAASAFGTVTLLTMVYMIRQEAGITKITTISLRILKPHKQEIAHFIVATNVSSILRLIRNSDLLLLGYLFTPTEVSYYRIARQLTNFMNLPLNPVFNASFPEFAYLWHTKQFQTLKQAVKRIIQLAFTISASIGIIFFVFGQSILVLTVTENFLPALPVFQWLIIGTMFAVTTSSLHPLLLAAGKANKITWASTGGLLVQISLILSLASSFNIVAAGIAYLSFYLVWAGICLLSLRQIWHAQLATSPITISH